MATTTDHELMQRLPGSHFCESACSADSVTLYSIDRCYWAGRTPFCDAVIAHSPAYGNVLFIDKEIQSSESDEAIYHEHLVHPLLNATSHIREKNVLVVGGGEGATVREVLKWDRASVASVSWVDIDGPLVDLCRRHLGWADDSVYSNPRVRFQARDVIAWLLESNMTFDVIILDLPDPDVAVLSHPVINNTDNTLYSRDFFFLLMAHLSPRGAIVSHVGPVAPGGDPTERRGGLTWVQKMAREIGLGDGAPYHVNIPSFQGEWGFWMSALPIRGTWPQGLRVMDDTAQTQAMTWPAYWTTPFIGH